MTDTAVFSLEMITDKAVWEDAIANRPEANFLQSWNWGVFHERLGKQVFHVGVRSNGEIVAQALCVKEPAKRGAYMTIAGGPLLDWQNRDLLLFLMNELKNLAARHHCIFIRIRPQQQDTPELRQQVTALGFREAPMHLTADLTLQLDLQLSLEELLAAMRKNTRYEVRSAEKEGIRVEVSENPDDIQAFNNQQMALAQKHHFVPFSFAFLDTQFRTFLEDHQVVLFHAYKDAELLASAFVIFYHQEAVYHYGISTPANDRLPGSYACQWAAIQWAKEHGGLKYNFWGIAPQEKPDHRFAGVSVFKRGFGGQEVAYLPAHDLQVSWRYSFIRYFEHVRKRLRRL